MFHLLRVVVSKGERPSNFFGLKEAQKGFFLIQFCLYIRFCFSLIPSISYWVNTKDFMAQDCILMQL